MTTVSTSEPLDRPHADAAADGRQHEAGVGERGERDVRDAVGEGRLRLPGDDQASRVLPTPPAPVSVTRRTSGRRTQLAQRADVLVAAEQRRRRDGERPGGRGSGAGSPADACSAGPASADARPRRAAAGDGGEQRCPLGLVEPQRVGQRADGVRVRAGAGAALEGADRVRRDPRPLGELLLRQPRGLPQRRAARAERPGRAGPLRCHAATLATSEPAGGRFRASGHPGGAVSCRRSALRSVLSTLVSGTASTRRISRGYFAAEMCSLQKATSSSGVAVAPARELHEGDDLLADSRVRAARRPRRP